MPNQRFFRKERNFSVKELAQKAGCTVIGDDKLVASDVATLDLAKEGEISFLSNPKYVATFQKSKASACIIEEKYQKLAPEGMTLLISKNPYKSYALIASEFYPPRKYLSGKAASATVSPFANVHESACISENVVISADVEIGENCYIGPNTFIDIGVKIARNTQVRANCTLAYTEIGENCIIHPGVRIGQDGFGFAPDPTGITKVEQLGIVEIGNNVEIGANTCIDRGAIENTVIGDGTKIDNLVQIAHNVRIGKYCFIVSQVGIAGSTTIGDRVMLGGQAGLAGHVNIGSGTMIAAQSGIMADVEPNSVLGGSPAVPLKQWLRMTAFLKKQTKKVEGGE